VPCWRGSTRLVVDVEIRTVVAECMQSTGTKKLESRKFDSGSLNMIVFHPASFGRWQTGHDARYKDGKHRQNACSCTANQNQMEPLQVDRRNVREYDARAKQVYALPRPLENTSPCASNGIFSGPFVETIGLYSPSLETRRLQGIDQHTGPSNFLPPVSTRAQIPIFHIDQPQANCAGESTYQSYPHQ
jgi:hypothetical protein